VFYVATAILIPRFLSGINPVLLICGGLVIYGGSLFIQLIDQNWMHFIVLALNGIALSSTMVPCMIEAKASGANFVGAAFIFEMGYSLNILVWTIIGHIVYEAGITNNVVIFIIKAGIAVGFAVLYYLFCGKSSTGGPKHQRLVDEDAEGTTY